MRRSTVAATMAAVSLLGGAAACSHPDPAAVLGVGLDTDGFFGVVVMCDEVRTFTHVEVTTVADGAPTLAWTGRTVEPITFFELIGDPPDNWVVEVDSGVVDEVAYRFAASADDLSVTGPEFTLEDIRALGADEVVDAAGTVFSVDDFLEQACGR